RRRIFRHVVVSAQLVVDDERRIFQHPNNLDAREHRRAVTVERLHARGTIVVINHVARERRAHARAFDLALRVDARRESAPTGLCKAKSKARAWARRSRATWFIT